MSEGIREDLYFAVDSYVKALRDLGKEGATEQYAKASDHLEEVWRRIENDERNLYGPIGYMCKVDFDYEVGNAMGGNVIYPSETDLRRNRKCVEGCGIVEVMVSQIRVVQEEADYDTDEED